MSALAVVTMLWLATGAEPAKPKLDIKIEKVKAPDMALPDMGSVPKAEGLKNSEEEKGPELKKTGTSEIRRRGEVKVEKVTHATNFVPSGNDYLPKGQISEFKLISVPAKIEPFKTCLTLNSPDGLTTPIMVALRTPSGVSVLASRGEVVFEAPGKMDFVIDWAGFEARSAGEYKVTVQMGLQKSQDFPLIIKVAQ